MPTVQEILMSKYLSFKEEISDIIPNFDEQFDEMDPTDLVDMMDLMLFLFPTDDTKRHLEELLALKGVELSADKVDELVPLCSKYVIFLNKVKKATSE